MSIFVMNVENEKLSESIRQLLINNDLSVIKIVDDQQNSISIGLISWEEKNTQNQQEIESIKIEIEKIIL